MNSKKAIHARAKNEQGYNLYFGINPRKKQSGTKADVAAATALYVDIDVKDFLDPKSAYLEQIDDILAKKPEVLQFIREQSKDLLPTILIDTGRGFQLYWVLEDPVILFRDDTWEEKVTQIEEMNAALERKFQADHCGNLDRIFRFPAFCNRKPVAKNADDLVNLEVNILHCDPSRKYTLDRFQETETTVTVRTEQKVSVEQSQPVELLSNPSDILEKAMNARNGAKFRQLWSGDYSGYKSQSEADFALCNLLAFWTNNDRTAIDSLFRQSGLYRDKWDIPFNGTTNGWYTIDKVLNSPADWKTNRPEEDHDPDCSVPYEPATGDTDPKPDDKGVKFYRFWYEETQNLGKETEKTKIHIDSADLLHFLQINGFGLLITGEHNHQVADVVRVTENVVSSTLEQNNTNITIRRFVLDFLEDLGAEDVIKVVLNRACTFFSLNFLTSLKPLDLTFYRDSRNRSCFFFQNGFLKVQYRDGKTTSVFLPYSELNECIWASQITQQAYRGIRTDAPVNPTYKTDRTSEFKTFLELVSQETIGEGDMFEVVRDNFPSFCYGISYLLHSYKDIARAFALLFVDNDSYEFSHGRRGKSLLAQAIEYFRKVTYEDGKTLNTESQFVFQSIETDSQIVQMEDVRKNFDFELFYPTITGHCIRERKGKGREKIPFAQAPKFVFTSNRPILGSGDSDLARWFILPFVGYFNRQYTPFDEFKHRLFEDWDQKEWNNFFDFITDCMEQYLSFSACPLYSRPEADLTTYNEEKLRGSMDAEYLEYFERHFQDLPFEYPKDLFFQEFKDEYPDFFDKYVRSKNRFTSKLKIYCQAKDLEINAASQDGREWKTDDSGKRWEYLVITEKMKMKK
jgi:hypothetical protein